MKEGLLGAAPSSTSPDTPPRGSPGAVDDLVVDSEGRCCEIQFFRLRGPQHRTFHCSWTAFFVAMIAIFGSAPLLETIRDPVIGIGLDEVQIGMAHAASMAAFPYRFFMGSLCDRFGPRRTVGATLLLVSLPTALLALCTDATSFIACRFFCGLLWSVAVGCQVQMSAMFSPSVIGSANGLCLGIGSSGVGVALLLIPQLNHLFRLVLPVQAAWRVTLLVPAVLLFLSGAATFAFSQDTPAGNVELGKGGPGRGFAALATNLRTAASDPRTWTMHVICALCLGVGWVVSNVIVRYYEIHFGLDNRSAGIVGALFGLNNAYARTFGGFLSDRIARARGHAGRIRSFCIFLALEAVSMAAFSRTTALLPSAILFWLLACFVQICEGFAFSVIPLLNPQLVGSVASLSGAGANVGAFFFSFLFASPLGQPRAFLVLAAIVAVLSPLVLTVRVAAPAPPPAPQAPAAAPAAAEREERPASPLATGRVLAGAVRSPAAPRSRRTAGLQQQEEGDEGAPRSGALGTPRSDRSLGSLRLPSSPGPRTPASASTPSLAVARLPAVRMQLRFEPSGPAGPPEPPPPPRAPAAPPPLNAGTLSIDPP